MFLENHFQFDGFKLFANPSLNLDPQLFFQFSAFLKIATNDKTKACASRQDEVAL